MNVKTGNLGPVAVNEGNFPAEVLQSVQPVLVAFCAPWSRPCHVLDTILAETTAALAGKAKVVRVNADDCLDLSLWYGIESVPTLIYFVKGEARVRIVGTASREAILARINQAGGAA